MTILVTGGTGQVGFELQRALAPLGQIDAPPRNQLELLDPAAVTNTIRSIASFSLSLGACGKASARSL